MLELLKINNIAVIDSAEVRFEQGLNIISGETGAGKSIIIEAISLLLGGRASTELLRAGCDEAIIEGLFNVSKIEWIGKRLERYGFKGNTSELVIKRTVHRGGKHRISLNGELATLSILHSVCEGLVDLCGQHEHQSLLKPGIQIELLDRYGCSTEIVAHYGKTFQEFKLAKKVEDELQKADQERIKRADFLKFQINEIQDAELQPDEERELQLEKQLHQSIEARAHIGDTVQRILESEENGVMDALRSALQKVRTLAQLDPHSQPLLEALERAVAEVEDVSIGLGRYLSGIELNPERLLQIQERLSLFANLRRKYGPTLAERPQEFLNSLKQEHASLEQIGDRLSEIKLKLKELEVQLRKQSNQLSRSRHATSTVLASTVTAELKDLKMSAAQFLIEITQKEDLSDWTATGADFVQFLIQTNAGEPARPLGKIASGGELSRIMLSIRRVVGVQGGIGVYLFDEIDNGMGGQTAFEVGKKLKAVSRYNQVICITHLPQVASFADHHLAVKKITQGDRTLTQIDELSQMEKREELARMLTGPELTLKSMENASELIEMASAEKEAC